MARGLRYSMKRSERILRKNSISKELPEWQQEIKRNTMLLEHIINNDLSHLWRWLLVLVLLVGGLYLEFFFGG